MTHALKLAVTSWADEVPKNAGSFAEQGHIAESLGYHSFWVPENHFGGERSIPSPLLLLSAIAARTETIALGSTSYLLPIRHPLQAAEEVAALDQLSGGRVILGVGRGVQDAMFKAFDVKTSDKRKIFKANLDIMLNALSGHSVLNETGENVFLAPLPIQKPYPPVWVAAFGPLAIKQAGKLGLPYLASPIETLGKLASNYSLHSQTVTESGHDKVAVVPLMRTVFITKTRSETERIRLALDAPGSHAMRETDSKIEEWTIVGDEAEVKDKLFEYVSLVGMTHLIVRGRIPGVDHKRHVESLASLANLTL